MLNCSLNTKSNVQYDILFFHGHCRFIHIVYSLTAFLFMSLLLKAIQLGEKKIGLYFPFTTLWYAIFHTLLAMVMITAYVSLDD